ncbi:hypothetical protein IDM40_14865 [Nocardiopsis sp. HNM0947]|uniref:Uncharacterized protein n=1 Tax=Nocardiopsis coralli TaxID=2772213 RepID=A0ABR9P813_9ACTN|nr:hypothetical protein [Nocardiopsis coralli]MBE2999980.1 hypothetical protein [Nocardiopsis coralli]
MASSIAAVVLLIAGIIVAVNVSGSRSYAELPTCRQLLGDLADDIPGMDRPTVDGHRVDEDDAYGHYDGEARSGVECNVEDPDRDDVPYVVHVNAFLYDHEDERGLSDLHHEMADEFESYEDGSVEDEYDDYRMLEWEETTIGDGGILAVQEYVGGSGSDENHRTAYGLFLTGNASVSYSYELEEREDEEEAMDFVRSFGGDLERQLRSEAESV